MIYLIYIDYRLAEILGRMFPSILKGKEGQAGSKRQEEEGGGGGDGGGGGGEGGGGEGSLGVEDSSEIVIGRVGEELGRRSKNIENKT